MNEFCDFKLWYKSTEWANYKAKGPAYGDLSRELTPIQRCPKCNKRLRMKAIYCIGGEFKHWIIPAHKPRVTRNPGPRRKSKISGRGK